MVETLIISLALVVCTYLISNAKVSLTLTHKHEEPKIQTVSMNTSGPEEPKTDEGEEPTQQAMIKAFQELLGEGDTNERY